jgi:hypothetical protein
LATEFGRLDFYALPVQKEDDFLCTPRNMLPLADARTISIDLAHQVERGKVGRYKWRKSTETLDLGPRRDRPGLRAFLCSFLAEGSPEGHQPGP